MNYPIMSQIQKEQAPWNTPDKPTKEIQVLISMVVDIKTDDYVVKDSGFDEDGRYYEDLDYSECDLHKLVSEQIPYLKDKDNWTAEIY